MDAGTCRLLNNLAEVAVRVIELHQGLPSKLRELGLLLDASCDGSVSNLHPGECACMLVVPRLVSLCIRIL